MDGLTLVSSEPKSESGLIIVNEAMAYLRHVAGYTIYGVVGDGVELALPNLRDLGFSLWWRKLPQETIDRVLFFVAMEKDPEFVEVVPQKGD